MKPAFLLGITRSQALCAGTRRMLTQRVGRRRDSEQNPRKQRLLGYRGPKVRHQMLFQISEALCQVNVAT